MQQKLKFVDLFAGIGGFHKALSELGHEFVFASEINSELSKIYESNFNLPSGTVIGDIKQIHPSTIPRHDILCAGFPCQPFSKAGFQLGLQDQVRGTLFGNIIEIANYHHPKFIILENVGNFEKHDKGNTWKTVKDALLNIGYHVQATERASIGGPGLISPHHLGFPHHRQRFFVVASQDKLPKPVFPQTDPNRITHMEQYVQKTLTNAEIEDSKLSQKQLDCINHWNDLLKYLPNSEFPRLPTFPIWGDEMYATYPYKDKTPMSLRTEELRKHIHLNGSAKNSKPTLNDYLDVLPAYAKRGTKFPSWKIRYISQNREWFQSIQSKVPKSWHDRLKEFPPSLRKLEWNCLDSERNLWNYMLQFRASGLRVKRYNSSPSLVAQTTTQIPILGPERRFLTRTEGLRLQGFPDEFLLPKSRTEAFRALGNAVHVEVAKTILKNVFSQD